MSPYVGKIEPKLHNFHATGITQCFIDHIGFWFSFLLLYNYSEKPSTAAYLHWQEYFYWKRDDEV